jgi:hypothetical protein
MHRECSNRNEFVTMNQDSSTTQLTRAEQETETEAKRLTAQVDSALAAVVNPSHNDTTDLEACADRLERAARDLVVTLRELARERRQTAKETG